MALGQRWASVRYLALRDVSPFLLCFKCILRKDKSATRAQDETSIRRGADSSRRLCVGQNTSGHGRDQTSTDTPVARGSNKPGTDSRVKDDFPVVHGSNSGGTNSGAKFRFPGDKDFPMAHEANNGETDCLASFPLLSIQALKTLIILVHPVGLHCLRTYKLTVNVPPLEVARAIILTRKTDKREMIGAQPAHVKP
ncbi:uncharacterized protein [Dermacentor albipictus]|uniref:uncharacterized protein isoform X5 n=1 Tax=Dermacentor albipictus TaxID=60249 RepID=UPI0038FBEE3A